MTTRPRWFAALFALCCAASLPVNSFAQAAAAAAPPRPTALENLVESAPVNAPNPAAASPQAAEKAERGEPVVRQTVVEDDGARIDELKVRGQTKRITVTPKKGGGKAYEIITSNGGPDQTEGPNGFNGAVGKRVWPVLSF